MSSQVIGAGTILVTGGDQVRQFGGGKLFFYELDLNNVNALSAVFRSHAVDSVVHFVAHKAVGDSAERPLDYDTNNVSGLLTLTASGTSHLIFSSSCSIYGDSREALLTEQSPARPTNPYARSKWMCELILEDLCDRYQDWSVTVLRYFNPAGARRSGTLGDDLKGVPSNIVPYLAQLAMGRHERVDFFGGDYPTLDGTAVRVCLPYHVVGRRPGDVRQLIVSPELAQRELGWNAERNLTDICRDALCFQLANSHGYRRAGSAFWSTS